MMPFVMKVHRQKFDLQPIMAAGGIVVKAGRSPLIAVVQRRKDGGWVLPRGKQKRRESALATAQREVEKETGHKVVVQEFLGTTSCESGGKPKIIQFWLMVSVGHAGRRDDDKEIKWLALNDAIARLSDPLEQAFLMHVGQQSLTETRGRLRSEKSRFGRNNLIGKLRPTSEFRKAPNGHKTPAARTNRRAGNLLREQRPNPAETPNRTSVAPNIIRRLIQRLKMQGYAPGRSAG